MSLATPRARNRFHCFPIRALTRTLRVALLSLLVIASVFALDCAQALAQDSGTLGHAGIESLQQAAGSASKGGLTDQEMEQLCQGAAGKHMNAADVEQLGKTMGLSPGQFAQLNDCMARQASSSTGKDYTNQNLAEPGKSLQPPIRKLETSSIENRFHELDTPYKLFTTPSSKLLEQFGYDLFATQVSTFAPAGNAAVGDNYMLGTDDELNVYTWGRVNQTLHLKVGRDGTVIVADIGPVQVAGLTFGQAKKLIEGRMSQITGVEVDVTMGQVRTIQVFVIGKVSQPGLYNVSALSHVSNALVAAGGISKVGSLRKIEVRRDNRVVATLDLYDFLLRGNTSGDVRLSERDVIFVPVIGPVAGVTGDVKSPAIYEMKGNEGLGNLLRMAGGVTAFGYAERLQLERVQNHQKRVALDVNLNERGTGQYPVYDGDLVKVFTVLPNERNIVRVKGNVNQPGSYEWHPGMRIIDLIRAAQGPSDHTFFDYALLQRRQGDERTLKPYPVNLGDAISSELSSDDLLLRPEDTLTVFSQNELSQVPVVSIRGQVRKPGSYPLTPGMSVRELVYGAGGLLENASRDRAELSRTEIANGMMAKYIHMDIDLRRALNAMDSEDVALQAGDELYVQQASNWHAPWHVDLAGQVMRPGPYPIREGERLSSVLEACGGFRPDAYPRAAVFIRQSVKQLQSQQLDQARARLEQDIARVALMPKQAGQSDTSADTLVALKTVLSQAESQEAVGRVVIHISSISALERSQDNVVLENADRLVIPITPASVQVLGQVYTPNAIVYQPELRVQDYLQKAGGATDGGDSEHIYVIKADGSVLTDQGVRQSGKNRLFPLLPSVSGGLMGQRLEPGDTVYVPEKLLYISSLQYTKDVTQIIANTATGLAVLGILATSL